MQLLISNTHAPHTAIAYTSTYPDGYAVQRNDAWVGTLAQYPGFTPECFRCHARMHLHSLHRCTEGRQIRSELTYVCSTAQAEAVKQCTYLDCNLHAKQSTKKNHACAATPAKPTTARSQQREHQPVRRSTTGNERAPAPALGERTENAAAKQLRQTHSQELNANRQRGHIP